MIELRDWIQSTRFAPKPWLLLGKGPSFSRRDEFPLEKHHVMGLNNVVGEMKVDVAHMMDVEVVEQCADSLAANCDYLVMPRRPHVHLLPRNRLLEDFLEESPVLRQIDAEGRLVWYNARTSPPVGRSPVIRARNFSSEAALDILGEMGVQTVRTLGIDGGSSQASEFEALPGRSEGLPSYDAQFRELEDIAAERGIDYDTLEEPLRIFVGVDDSQVVAARVLEYTIRKYASRPVRFTMMVDLETPVPKDPANRARTGFSFSRFHIPRLAGYSGKALYLDADMQVFGDIAQLWKVPFGEHKVLCTRQDEPPEQWKGSDWFKPGRQMSVMMLDCSRLDWDIHEIIGGLDEGRFDYADLLFDLAILSEDEVGDYLPPEWNHLEHHVPGETRLLHYTVVPTQPWKNDENPLRHLWESAFEEAKTAALVHPYEIRRLVRAGYLKRSVLGRPAATKPVKALYRAIAKVERALLDLEPRVAVFRHPTVLRLRHRFGLL